MSETKKQKLKRVFGKIEGKLGINKLFTSIKDSLKSDVNSNEKKIDILNENETNIETGFINENKINKFSDDLIENPSLYFIKKGLMVPLRNDPVFFIVPDIINTTQNNNNNNSCFNYINNLLVSKTP